MTSDSLDTPSGPPLRLLQVGMGGFGRGWAADVIPTVPGVELVGCVDLDPDSLAQAQKLLSLPEDRYFRDLNKALAAVESDAVLITTTIEGHIPVALAALAAGKHVLTEKPFAPSLAEAQRAVDAAEAAGLVLMVSQNYRYFPAVQAVRTLVASGELGPLGAVYIDFRQYDNGAPRGRHKHYVVPQPMLVDMAIHHFDLMRAVMGQEAEEMRCVTWNDPWSKFVDPASAVATLRFDGGARVQYRGSWTSPGPKTTWAGDWRMEFEGAEVTWTSRAGGGTMDEADWVVVRPLDGEPQQLPLPKLSYLDRAGSLDTFLHAIRTGTEPPTSGRLNLGTLALTIASVESAETGAPVLLTQP